MKTRARTVLIFSFFAATGTIARGDSGQIKASPDPANYLVFYDRMRNFRTLQLAAEGLAAAAQDQAAFDEAVYQRNLTLFSENAVAKEELRISKMARDTSRFSIDRYQHDALANAKEVDANKSLLPYVQGQSVNLAIVYSNFKQAWDEQCAARAARVEEAKARYELANYRLEVVNNLAQSNAASYEELHQRQMEQAQAKIEVNTSTSLLEICHDGEPTLDFLSKLIR